MATWIASKVSDILVEIDFHQVDANRSRIKIEI